MSSVTPWEPLEGIAPLREVINRLFEDSVVGLGRFEPFGRMFPLDVRETDRTYVVEAALPGFTPEQIQISATQDALTIRASTTSEQETGPHGTTVQKEATEGKGGAEGAAGKPGVYVRRERHTGEMARMIHLPAPIDPSHVTATYERGELTVTLPKAAHTQPKRIPVRVKETTGIR
jgi:HSP20 family protein